MNNVIYNEKAPNSKTLRLVLAGILSILAFLVFFAFFGNFFGFKSTIPEVKFNLLLMLLIFNFVLVSFFNMKFKIKSDRIEALMFPFKYTILFSEIEDIKIIKTIPWYIGWGIRFWGGRIAFISIHNKGVEIEKKSGFFRKVILTTKNPDDFIKIVKKLNQANWKPASK